MKTPLHLGGKADAYLEWAIATRFAGFGDIAPQTPGIEIGVILEWAGVAAPAAIPRGVSIAAAHGNRRIATAVIGHPAGPVAAFGDKEIRTFITGNVAAIELASPVANPWGAAIATASPGVAPPLANARPGDAIKLPEVVVACVDDSFPVANARFNAPRRLLRLWDQSMRPEAARAQGWLTHAHRGAALERLGFAYGAELAPPGSVAGMPHGHPFPAASDLANDHRYYMRSGLDRQRFRTSHGAHVLDAMAGPASMRDRLARRAESGDAASRVPYVLVKLPDHAIDDPTGRWLGSHVLDALAFIEHATAGVRKVVVNLSWGPQTGPRDGSSLLERAIDEMVDGWKEEKRDLHVVLPAGNSYLSRAHASFARADGCDELVWCVPPGGRIPSFLEAWYPKGSSAPELEITAPSGQSLRISGTGLHRVSADSSWGAVCVERGGRFMVLVALAPTSTFADKRAPTSPHGRWRLGFSAAEKEQGDVEIHVSRADPNMGANAYAQQSYLWDPVYEAERRRRDGTATGRYVRGAGSLNGLATGRATEVVAGYRLSDRRISRYSSAGPTSGRQGPDWAYPADESILRLGIRSGATRAGTSLRLAGTSIASPQRARDIANGVKDPQGPAVGDARRQGKGLR